MNTWKCAACGYEFSGEEQPEKCPACGAGRERLEAAAQGEEEQSGAAGQEGTAAGGGGPEKKWRCTICNYIHTGPEPPDVCPVCGADSSYFVEVTDEEATGEEGGAEEQQPETAPGGAGKGSETAGSGAGEEKKEEGKEQKKEQKKEKKKEKKKKEKKPFGLLGALVDRFHMHPISVHSPNGVLPVALIFLLIAVYFQYWLLEWASFFNYIVVLLSLPLVFATGYIAWKRKYNGALTWIFKVKLACMAITAVLVSIIVVWRIIDADIAQGGDLWAWVYIGLGVLAVVTVTIAGWLGGKLVFKNG